MENIRKEFKSNRNLWTRGIRIFARSFPNDVRTTIYPDGIVGVLRPGVGSESGRKDKGKIMFPFLAKYPVTIVWVTTLISGGAIWQWLV